ncbi:MAG: superoxide dismutase [Alphaproteobacteria bacterium]|nr:superoxide dismutase [Alphaproteobacteria bacterium]
MTISLPALPYSMEALEPHISARTLEFHYGKHHQAYVNNLNKLLEGSPLAGKSLEEIIHASAQKGDLTAVFNNAAQVWNHTFYWNSMKPNGGGEIPQDLKDLIISSFGDVATFETAFKQAAVTQFGSGWAWLVYDAGVLKIVKTSNADTPLTTTQVPLLTCDVWEHAYYIDYQNRRPDYVENYFSSLVNWEFAADNLNKARRA